MFQTLAALDHGSFLFFFIFGSPFGNVAVCQEKTCPSEKTHHLVQRGIVRVTTPALPVNLSRLPWFTMNVRRLQRTHHLSGMRSSLNASKDLVWELLTLRPL